MTFIMTYGTPSNNALGEEKNREKDYVQWLGFASPVCTYCHILIVFVSPGDSEEVWAKLQETLSTLESSASRVRSLAVVPQPLQDEEAQTQHLSAARESWVKVTEVDFHAFYLASSLSPHSVA